MEGFGPEAVPVTIILTVEGDPSTMRTIQPGEPLSGIAEWLSRHAPGESDPPAPVEPAPLIEPSVQDVRLAIRTKILEFVKADGVALHSGDRESINVLSTAHRDLYEPLF